MNKQISIFELGREKRVRGLKEEGKATRKFVYYCIQETLKHEKLPLIIFCIIFNTQGNDKQNSE